MAFRTGETTPSLGKALEVVEKNAAAIRAACEAQRTKALDTPLTYIEILDLHQNVFVRLGRIQAVAGLSGLASYAVAQYPDDPSYNIVAEYNSMTSAINSYLAYVTTTLPSPTGSFSGSSFVWQTYNTTQTAGLRTELAAVVASIGT